MKRQSVIGLVAIAVVAVVAIAMAIPRKYRYISHEKAANELAASLRAGRWERIVDYIPDADLRDEAMTRSQAERLFCEYIKPAVANENADLSVTVQTTEYNSTVRVGKGLTKFEILLSNYPALMRPSFGLGIRTSLTQLAAMRSIRANPELQGRARRAETSRQLALVVTECNTFGLKALPAIPPLPTQKGLKLFP